MSGFEVTAASPVQTPAPHVAAGAAAVCAHCGLDVPASLIVAAEPRQFCCSGCRTVYELLSGCGLDAYYRVRAAADGGRPAQVSGRGYEEYDDPTFEALHARPLPGGLKKIELFLEGVHCGACIWLVERLARVAPQVIESRLDFRRALVRIIWNPAAGTLAGVARALDSLGYAPHPARDAEARALRRDEDRRLLVRIGVAGACAGNAMMLAFALYSGVFSGIEAQYEQLFRWLSMGLGVLALAWPGSLFFRGAWAALRTRTAHLDLPVAIGLAAGGLAGAINTVLGRGEIYFDSLAVLVFLLLVGRAIQRRQQRAAADSVELLYSLTPTAARRVDGDVVRVVPVETLRPGDLIEVAAGETIAVDGRVERGASSVDQSLLTGESVPATVGVGDAVCAGTINLAAALHVRATATGEQSRVGRLMDLLERSARQQAPILRVADRVAGWFTLAMLGLAGITFALWLGRGLPTALDNATALLLVCCPCALGLSTPLIVTVAIGRAARRRILIKGGEVLEALARPGTLFVDKTGTLTQGRMRVVRWEGPQWVRPLVAAVERQSSHPVARAFLDAFADSAGAATATDVTQTSGQGIRGTVAGRIVEIGSPQRLGVSGAASPHLLEALHAFSRDALTPIVVRVDGVLVAVAGLGDPLRPDAAGALERLRGLGWHVGILSGDDQRVVDAVGARLSVPSAYRHGLLTPEEKLAFVQGTRADGRSTPIPAAVPGSVAPAGRAAGGNDSRSAGSGSCDARDLKRRDRTVVMVGDGVNDAAALAAATVGIAVHGGAEASLTAADVYLDRPGLGPIVELIEASIRTYRLIWRSLAISASYNALAAGLAMAGVLNPLIAAVLMPISSFTVLALALSGRSFRRGSEAPVRVVEVEPSSGHRGETQSAVSGVFSVGV